MWIQTAPNSHPFINSMLFSFSLMERECVVNCCLGHRHQTLAVSKIDNAIGKRCSPSACCSSLRFLSGPRNSWWSGLSRPSSLLPFATYVQSFSRCGSRLLCANTVAVNSGKLAGQLQGGRPHQTAHQEKGRQIREGKKRRRERGRGRNHYIRRRNRIGKRKESIRHWRSTFGFWRTLQPI